MDPTRTKLQILSLEWNGEISRQRGGLPSPSVFIKVKGMLEKVVHENSTRYIVKSLQERMNKRKTASVYSPAPATLQVKSYRCNTQFGRKAVTDTNLVETLQLPLQYDQEQEKN